MCGDLSGTTKGDTDEKNPGPEIAPFSEVVRFHGHLCPGVTLGYCAAKIGIRELRSARDVDEELVVIVENDACGVDAIQVVTGCTMGKGNLIFQDYGKHVYTFINRATGDAVRVSLRDMDLGHHHGTAGPGKNGGERPSPEDRQAMRKRMQEHVDRMLAEPPENYFDVRHVKAEIPEKARLFNSVKCSKCGERVAESRARVQDGDFVCIPCFREYSRGW